jgi:hypothetical protein
MRLRNLGGIVGAALIAFLIIALGSKAQLRMYSECDSLPWGVPIGKCAFKQKTTISSHTVNWPKRTPPETDCYLTILVCNFKLQRDTKNPLGTQCPTAKDFSQPTFCCDEFDKAVKTKFPCDPMKDADCDGLPNDTDPDPLGARPVDLDDKCKQLGYHIFQFYLTAGANADNAAAASGRFEEDCRARRKDKMCGIPESPSWPPEDPKFPKNPDPDNKCKQLGSNVHDEYLTAGANENTATYAGTIARQDCQKRRAGKM